MPYSNSHHCLENDSDSVLLQHNENGRRHFVGTYYRTKTTRIIIVNCNNVGLEGIQLARFIDITIINHY